MTQIRPAVKQTPTPLTIHKEGEGATANEKGIQNKQTIQHSSDQEASRIVA